MALSLTEAIDQIFVGNRKYNNAKLKFYIGDVRDRHSVAAAMRGVDYAFHAAALKQVPSCEFHPMQAVRTNGLGTENVLEAAINASVKRVVCLSTDKAVYPINAMGISKAMMEKVMVAASRNLEGTHRDLRHTLWQRDGFAGIGDSTLCRASPGWSTDHRNGPEYDPFHDDVERCCGSRAARVRRK